MQSDPQSVNVGADKQKMARRRKGLDPFEILPVIVGLGLLAVFVPGGRETIQGFVGLAVWIGIFLGIALLLFVGARLWLKTINDAPQVATSPSTSRPTSIRSTGFAATVVVDPTPSLQHQLRSIDWFQFEKLIALAYAGTGTVTRKGGANPDGGIDLIVERQGERIGVQCKHWKSWTVGVKVVREMIGAMADAGLKKGIIVSLNPYSIDARELARRHNIEVVDEDCVVNLLKYLDQREVQAILGDTTKICPKCEREMVMRTATKGRNEGGQFWGCSGYPRCRFVMQC